MTNEEVTTSRVQEPGLESVALDHDVATMISRLREDNEALRKLNSALHQDMARAACHSVEHAG
ncbi:hypothetical protein FP2506_08196 [Fulvimarina pelagi HTCC2506]|uniref:Uncharacterized protein n=1 Tax=Fulvimarina pelagi HTCC2506 TaxID=314231 RepID=Q0G6A7_9HYPH|nr:hypothetical protein [Fulvimarina pelagi]EAU42807.1 hypothetical protein FP2506_08196 [Fulvimarina pelagi HTCC2506]